MLTTCDDSIGHDTTADDDDGNGGGDCGCRASNNEMLQYLDHNKQTHVYFIYYLLLFLFSAV